MIHFVPSGGRIGADHLKYLIEYFEQNDLEHTVHDGLIGPSQIEEGHAYVACDLNMDYNLAPVKDRIFQVQLPHNLTGLKGSNLAVSHADLHLLPGRQLARALQIRLPNSRYEIRGYAKWDSIYPERFLQKQRREELAGKLKMDPERRWVCFYPTAPNETCRGNQYQAVLIHNHLKRELGEPEFVFCEHANTRSDVEAKRAVQHLKDLASGDPRIHVIDGGDSLSHIAACDLFITDIASTVITAISMEKPVLFVRIEHSLGKVSPIEEFQCGVLYEQVKDFKEFIRSYRPPEPVRRLFKRCVEYDDDRNRERITRRIQERYEQWLKTGGPAAQRTIPSGPGSARRIADMRNIAWQTSTITQEDREELLGQRGCVVWLTGLSASGKTTIADRLAARLMADGHLAFVLDGDNLRHGLNADLGFSAEDRDENIRRVGEVAALMARTGLIAISAFISPYRAGRDRARATALEGRFVEVYVSTPLQECERRDPRGLYRKARAGQIKEFTGLDAPYEEPTEPEIVLRTVGRTPEECAEEVFQFLKETGYLAGPRPAANPSSGTAKGPS